MASVLLPHPLTGRPFASPVAPGTGWPGDTADAGTPVATALVVGLAPAAQSTFPISDAVSAVKCTMSQPTAARSASRARPRSNASREEWNSNPSSSTPTPAPTLP